MVTFDSIDVQCEGAVLLGFGLPLFAALMRLCAATMQMWIFLKPETAARKSNMGSFLIWALGQ